jgi:hypothetical protein
MQFERRWMLADRRCDDSELPADQKRRRLDAPGCAHSDQQERFCCCHFGCDHDRNRAEHPYNNNNNDNNRKHDHLGDNHRDHSNDDHRSEPDNDDNDCSCDNHLPDNYLDHWNDDHRPELDNDDNDCSYDNHLPDNNLPDNHPPIHNNDLPDHNHNDDADHDDHPDRHTLVRRARRRYGGHRPDRRSREPSPDTERVELSVLHQRQRQAGGRPDLREGIRVHDQRRLYQRLV